MSLFLTTDVLLLFIDIHYCFFGVFVCLVWHYCSFCVLFAAGVLFAGCSEETRCCWLLLLLLPCVVAVVAVVVVVRCYCVCGPCAFFRCFFKTKRCCSFYAFWLLLSVVCCFVVVVTLMCSFFSFQAESKTFSHSILLCCC